MAKLIIGEVPDRLGDLCYPKYVVLVFLRSRAERFSSSCLSTISDLGDQIKVNLDIFDYILVVHYPDEKSTH